VSERNWSSYDFIHSKKRNKLTPARAEKLVYVFHNIRSLRKVSSVQNAVLDILEREAENAVASEMFCDEAYELNDSDEIDSEAESGHE
jgi:hypothetical protein